MTDEGLKRRAPKVGLFVADRPSASVGACFSQKPYDKSRTLFYAVGWIA
jgi:hypothetical protein